MSTKVAAAPDPGDVKLPRVNGDLIKTEVAPFVKRAQELRVTTKEEDEEAKREFLNGKKVKAFIEALYKGPKAILHKAHKDMVAEEAAWLKPLNSGLALIEQKCLAYMREEQRKAAEEAKRLQDLARKAEEERQLAEAIDAEESGDTAAADAILAEPTTTAVVSVEAQVAKVENVGTRKTYGGEVFDMKAFVKRIARECDNNPGLLTWLEATPALNKVVQAQRGLFEFDGVRVVEKESLTGRTS